MKIKRIFLVLVIALCLSGCVNIEKLSYEQIVNNLSLKSKKANTFKRGHQFYVPKGLHLKDSGDNYAILTSPTTNYYMYIDLVSYNAKKNLKYEPKENLVYSTSINYQDKKGYVEIKLCENNQYLIEIVYNYAKIEVMVDESLVKKTLANSISILNSIEYNDLIIEQLLSDDNLDYTEEVFDLFENTKDDSNILDYDEEKVETEEELEDTDDIN